MKYLGVDFGLRRVGLAISEGEFASPLTVIEVKSFKDAVEKVSQVIKKEEFNKIVVGLPEGKIGQTVLGFVKALKKEGFEVETADETLSSQKAIAHMVLQNVSQKTRRFSDATAAAIILQNYLDSE